MAAPDTRGRMLNQDISESENFANLSPAAAVLFCMIIPHLNSYGKMNGGVGYLKEIVCPKVTYISERKLPRLLHEIDTNTNVKWFKRDGRLWIHSINFLTEHQNLRKDRLGKDLLPSYSGGSPGLSPAEVPLEVEEEGKKKGEVERGPAREAPPPILEGFEPTKKMIDEAKANYGFSDTTIDLETRKYIVHRRASEKEPPDPNADWMLWMLRQYERVNKGRSASKRTEPEKECPECGKQMSSRVVSGGREVCLECV